MAARCHVVPLCRTEGFDNVVEFGAQGGDASYDFGEAVLELVDVDLLSGVARFHVGADGEIVVGSHDVFKGGEVRHVLFLHLLGKEGENLVEMSIGEDIVVGRLLVEVGRGGIDELHAGVALVLGEHEDVGGNGRAIEQSAREGDDGLHIVLFDEVLTDFLFRTTAIEDAREADNGCATLGREIVEGVEHKGKVGIVFGSEHASRCKAVVIDEGGIVFAHPLHGIGRVGDDGIEGAIAAKLWAEEGVAKGDVKLVVVDGVEKHVHARQVVGGVIDFLPEKSFFDEMIVKLLLGLEQERTAAASGVVDFVDALLSVGGDACEELRHLLGGEKLSSGLTGTLGVVADEKLVGIAKEVDFAVGKVGEIETCHASEHGS